MVTTSMFVCKETPAQSINDPLPNRSTSATQFWAFCSPRRQYTCVRSSLPHNLTLVSSTNNTLAQSAYLNRRWRIAQASRSLLYLFVKSGYFMRRLTQMTNSLSLQRKVVSDIGQLFLPKRRRDVLVAVVKRSLKWLMTMCQSWR